MRLFVEKGHWVPQKLPRPGSSWGSASSPGRNSFCFIVSFKDRVLKSPKYIALENADSEDK